MAIVADRYAIAQFLPVVAGYQSVDFIRPNAFTPGDILHDNHVVDFRRPFEREFHDALLTHGPIPIELIRAAMLNLPLTPDMKSTWRFAGEPPAE